MNAGNRGGRFLFDKAVEHARGRAYDPIHRRRRLPVRARRRRDRRGRARRRALVPRDQRDQGRSPGSRTARRRTAAHGRGLRRRRDVPWSRRSQASPRIARDRVHHAAQRSHAERDLAGRSRLGAGCRRAGARGLGSLPRRRQREQPRRIHARVGRDRGVARAPRTPARARAHARHRPRIARSRRATSNDLGARRITARAARADTAISFLKVGVLAVVAVTGFVGFFSVVSTWRARGTRERTRARMRKRRDAAEDESRLLSRGSRERKDDRIMGRKISPWMAAEHARIKEQAAAEGRAQGARRSRVCRPPLAKQRRMVRRRRRDSLVPSRGQTPTSSR